MRTIIFRFVHGYSSFGSERGDRIASRFLRYVCPALPSIDGGERDSESGSELVL